MARRRRREDGGLPGELPESYTEVCWRHHERACVVCGEANIVAAHHYNGKHWDDRPENLVPLCPTHHAYWHSRFQHLIREKVDAYVQRFLDDAVKFDDPLSD